MMLPIPLLDLDSQIRFWGLVKRGTPTECWLWLGSMKSKDTSNNRPKITVNGSVFCASRVSWALHYKEDPGPLFVCHECDNVLCMNPSHLWLGTQEENMKDCVSKNRKSLTNSNKIEDWDIPIILQLRESGHSYDFIAKRYRVHRTTIRRLCLGDTHRS